VTDLVPDLSATTRPPTTIVIKVGRIRLELEHLVLDTREGFLSQWHGCRERERYVDLRKCSGNESHMHMFKNGPYLK